ncbi:hypothetical protein D1AOALGA4SA_10770 [Olavius algarvensis Delta 1 endosymbiont]|nr:hypothetical protein D1AOALGA4SA_10770 [Olavius algarvensis Delta 1 endosymbiont]
MTVGKNAMLHAAAISMLILTGACASKPFLVVQYQLPRSPDTLAGKEVSLAIRDLRDNQTVLSQSAKKSFREFDGTYSLVVLKTDGSGNLLGVYGINALLAEIFKQRLDNHGLTVSEPTAQTEYKLEVKLKKFKLDLAGRKWITSVSYQAILLQNGRPLAMETVNGSAERLKIMGIGDAEKLLSELLSDTVNKLDLVKLFKKM